MQGKQKAYVQKRDKVMQLQGDDSLTAMNEQHREERERDDIV